MTLLNRTPQARKKALAYCRRCLAVMVCCVLVFGLTIPAAPRAKAVAGVDDVAFLGISGLASIGAGFASHPVEGSLGQFVITGSGVSIKSGTVLDDLGGTTYFDAKAQEVGYQLMTYLVSQTGEAAEWASSLITTFQGKGGVAAGDSIEIPAEVVALVRQWAVDNVDFTDGSAVYTRYGIQYDGGFLLFTQFPANAVWDNWYTVSLGSILFSPGVDQSAEVSFAGKNGDVFKYVWTMKNESTYNYKIFRNGVSQYDGNFDLSVPQVWSLAVAPYSSTSAEYLYPANILLDGYRTKYNCGFWSASSKFVPAADFADVVFDVSSTFFKSDTFDTTSIDAITVTVPQLPAVDVGGYTVPVADVLTPADVVQDPAMPTTAPGTGVTAQDIAGAIGQAVPGAVASGIAQALPAAIAQSLPITGAIAGDQVVADTLTEPDSLGAVFISKFPFCIPWDIVKAIQLLAAPPVTPRWELDFMQPIAGRVGGFQGSTKLVLDFSDYPIVGVATRWVSTVLFVYSLASGTKRLLWTA